ncbi:MAG: cell division FtsA domain-containing protein [Candidatus Omnitrophota bacterium]
MEIIAIDIGADTTKIARMERRKTLLLSNVFIFKTPYAVFQPDAVSKEIDPSGFWKQIFTFISLSRLRRSKVAITLAPEYISTIVVSLPKMNMSELFLAAIVEAKRTMIPASTADHNFECSFVGESGSPDNRKFEVSVIRTENKHVQRILDLCKNADIIPSLIAPSPCTIAYLSPKETWKKDEDIAFVDLGVSNLNISISRNGKLVSTRSLGYSLRDIAKDISAQLGISPAEAERIIREEGVPQVDFDIKNKVAIVEEIMRQKYEAGKDPSLPGASRINRLELRMLWQAHIERMIQELRRTFIYYKEHSAGRRVESVYFLGGGCLIKNLVSMLAGLIGGEGGIVKPFANLKAVETKNISNEIILSAAIYANAISLAWVKGSEDAVVNFLPKEFKRKETAARWSPVLFLIALGLAFIFILAGGYILAQRGYLQKQIARLDLELSGFKDISERMNALSQQKNILDQRFFKFNLLSDKTKRFHSLLRIITNLIPREVVFNRFTAARSSLSIERQEGPGQIALGGAVEDASFRMKIEAWVLADYERALEIVELFKGRLESSQYFSKVSLTPLSLEQINSADFGGNGQESRLTGSRIRKFSLSAEIAEGK